MSATSSDDDEAGVLASPPANSFLSSDSSSEDEPSVHRRRATTRRTAPRTIVGDHGRYLLGERIGSGAFSVVRAAINVVTLEVVAVKVMDLRKLRRTRQGLQRAEGEIRVLRALRGHPHVVQMRDVVKDAQRLYLVLEMCAGGALQDYIQRERCGDVGMGRCMPPAQAATIARDALTALAYVHGRGYVHRDVKPANLMVSASRRVKLSDFGVAQSLDRYRAADSVSQTLGSPAFQAPEIASGADSYSGTKVDVWALGVSVYYLLVGDVPFKGDSHLALFRSIAAGKYAVPTQLALDDNCIDCVAKMLCVDFNRRWSVAQLLHHPWIVGAARQRTAEQQRLGKWVLLPIRTFNVVELANRYLASNSSPAQVPLPPTSSARSSLRSLFASQNAPPAQLSPPGAATATQADTFGGDSSDDELTAALRGAQVTRWIGDGVVGTSAFGPQALDTADYELAREFAGQRVTPWTRGISPHSSPADAVPADDTRLPADSANLAQLGAPSACFDNQQESDDELAAILRDQAPVRWGDSATPAGTARPPSRDASQSGEIRRVTGSVAASSFRLPYEALPGVHFDTSATTDVASPVFPSRAPPPQPPSSRHDLLSVQQHEASPPPVDDAVLATRCVLT